MEDKKETQEREDVRNDQERAVIDEIQRIDNNRHDTRALVKKVQDSHNPNTNEQEADILDDFWTCIFRNDPVLIGGLPLTTVRAYLNKMNFDLFGSERSTVLTYEEFKNMDKTALGKKRRIVITGADNLGDREFKEKLWYLRAEREGDTRKSVIIISEHGDKKHTLGAHQGNPYYNGIKCLFLKQKPK